MNSIKTNRSLDRRDETLLMVIVGLIPLVSLAGMIV